MLWLEKKNRGERRGRVDLLQISKERQLEDWSCRRKSIPGQAISKLMANARKNVLQKKTQEGQWTWAMVSRGKNGMKWEWRWNRIPNMQCFIGCGNRDYGCYFRRIRITLKGALLWLLSRWVMSDSAALWTTACQASLSFTTSWSLLKVISTELVMPSKHLILCRPLLLLSQSFPASGIFPMSQLFMLGGESTGASVSASLLPMNDSKNCIKTYQ